MGFFNKEVELIIPPKKLKNDKQIKSKSLNGYDAIREKLDEGNTLTTHASEGFGAPSPTRRAPVEPTKPKTKVSIGL